MSAYERERFDEYAVVLDANILLAHSQIEEIDWGINPVIVFILESVLHDELEGLRRHTNTSVAQRAKEAFDHLCALEQRMNEDGYKVPGGWLRIVPAPRQMPAPLKHDDVDQQQIGFAYNWIQEKHNRFCAIVTRDRAMHDIAISARPPVPVVTPGSGNLQWEIQEQLQRLIKWTGVWPKPVAAERQQVEPPEPASPDRFEESARRLYQRIQSAGFRAILAIPPRKMRMAVGAHLVQNLAADKTSVVFLYASDAQSVEQWRVELHRRCKLPSGSICAFGGEEGVAVGRTRVLIFRHEQIERRLNQYVARFSKQGRQIVALVDSCELVNAVGISMLLFECSRFVGFTQHPFDHAQATGGRMLGAFFHQQTLATYSFADAEVDGWLHPYDFIRRPVVLADDQEEQYDRINQKFVAIRNLIREQYPQLVDAQDFWQALHDLLDRAVDHQAGSLFELREMREEVAQIARGKLEVVDRLVNHSGKSARCLIFDREQLWTSVLKNHFGSQNKKVAVVEKGADETIWSSVWREFEQARVDCLILHDVPPPELAPAVIQRLILLTPLTPLTLLSAMTDWTLSHASGGPPVSIDLLYAADTPEQRAMVDFANACFDLRFR